MGVILTGADPAQAIWPVPLAPIEVIRAPTGYDVVGSTDDNAGILVVTADASDATYIRQSVPNDYFHLRCAGLAMPAGSRITKVQAVARVSFVETPTNPNRDIMVANGDRNGPGGIFTYDPPSNHYFPGAAIQTLYAPGRDRGSNNAYLDQSDLERGLSTIFGINTAYGGLNGSVARWYKAWVNLEYDMPPTAVVTAPAGAVTTSRSPLVAWDYTDDWEIQTGYRVRVRDSGGTIVYDTGRTVSGDTFHQVATPLTNGSYTAEVLVYQGFSHGPDFTANEYATSAFTVDLLTVAPPTISATPVDETVALAVVPGINLLNFDQSTLDNGPWDWIALTGCTRDIETSIVKSGNASMKITLTAALGQVGLPVRTFPAAPGEIYGTGVQLRSGPGTRTWNVGLSFYDATSTLLQTSSDSFSVASGSWPGRATHAATAPAGTAFVRPIITYNGAIGEEGYVDEAQLNILSSGLLPLPPWARGGFYAPVISVLTFADWSAEDESVTMRADSTAAGSAYARSTTQARRGAWSHRLTKSTAGAGNVKMQIGSPTVFAATPGQQWWGGWSIYSVLSRTTRMDFEWLNSSGGVISTSSLTFISSTGLWRDKTAGGAVAPALTVGVRIKIGVDACAQNEFHYFDAVFAYPSVVEAGAQPGLYPGGLPVPLLAIEYSDDAGTTWTPLLETEIAANVYELEYADYTVPSGQTRTYRAMLKTTENGIGLNSLWSATDDATLTLGNLWLHAVTDPAGTSHPFVFDGHGRSRDLDSGAATVIIEGQTYPFSEFTDASTGRFQQTVALAATGDEAAFEVLLNAKSEIVARDRRGRAVRGVFRGKIDDTPWGATGNLTIDYTGEQP